ncbi:MAG: TonB-dependent receptor [Bacteroidota bacterium]
MKTFSICFIISSLLFSGICFSQDATVKGKITDAKTKETLIGVNIVLKDNTGVASDIDGNYVLNISEGKHTITYRFIGYTTQNKSIEIKAGETLTIDIAMKEEIEELGIVVVSAGKFEQRIEDVTVSMDVIMPNMVENKATTNIETVMDQSPGVQIIDKEPQIRSGSGYSFGVGTRVMIMVDDLPVISGDAGRVAWHFLPVENLEQIEIIKGAASVLYGSSALNGVINIRTAYPKDKPQTKINIFSGIYDKPQREYAVWWEEANPIFTGMNFFHSRKIKNFDLVIGGNIFLDDGFVGPAPDSLILKTFPANDTVYHPSNSQNAGSFENRIRLNGNLRWRPKKIEGLNYGMNFNAMYSQFTSQTIMLDTDTGMYRSFPSGVTRTLNTVFYIDPFVNYYDKRGNKYCLKSRIFYIDNNNDNDQANESTVYYIEPQYQKQFKKIKDFTITSGITATSSWSNSEFYRRLKEDSTTTDINTSSSFAGYIQLDKKFRDRITVSAGARRERFEINNTDNDSKTVFRTGVSAKVMKETYVRASFGQGFRFPTIAEKYASTNIGSMKLFPNSKVQAESSWNVEVGIKQGIKFGKFYGYLDIAAFQQELTNSIEFTYGYWGNPEYPFDFDSLGFIFLNVGEARIRGIDASVIGHGQIGPITINVLAGYTYTEPKVISPRDTIPNDVNWPITYKNSSSDTTNNILKYRFQHLAKADVELTYSKFSMGLSFRYNSFMSNVDIIFEKMDKNSGAEPIYEGRLPTGLKEYRQEHNQGDYVYDLRASYQMSETSKVAVVVKNLLNREYMLRPLQISPPRTFCVQYTLDF